MTVAARKPWLQDFVLLAAIWGSSFLFMRMGAKEFGAMAHCRHAGGGCVAVPAAHRRLEGPAAGSCANTGS